MRFCQFRTEKKSKPFWKKRKLFRKNFDFSNMFFVRLRPLDFCHRNRYLMNMFYILPAGLPEVLFMPSFINVPGGVLCLRV